MTGASGPQTLTYGIVPQIMPAFAGISVFRWDINIRESTVVGLELNAQIMELGWAKVSVILAIFVVSEWLSATVRHAII